MTNFAEEQKPFLLRGRYTWGMTMEEVKQQAAEEGLILERESSFDVYYQDVPVAGIVARSLSFSFPGEGELDHISYTLTDDPEEGLALYPLFLEQLTLLYGEPDEIEFEEYVARWIRSDIRITLRGQLNDLGCFLGYLHIPPRPTPEPQPTPIPLTMDGL